MSTIKINPTQNLAVIWGIFKFLSHFATVSINVKQTQDNGNGT